MPLPSYSKCSVAWCGGNRHTKHHCRTHDRQWKKEGKPDLSSWEPLPKLKACHMPDCDGPVFARGKCAFHYRRYRSRLKRRGRWRPRKITGPKKKTA